MGWFARLHAHTITLGEQWGGFASLNARITAFSHSPGSEKELVSGVEKAIGAMKSKESARVIVKPKYGYGEEGNPDLGIPGNAELNYDIRLSSFQKVSV